MYICMFSFHVLLTADKRNGMMDLMDMDLVGLSTDADSKMARIRAIRRRIRHGKGRGLASALVKARSASLETLSSTKT